MQTRAIGVMLSMGGLFLLGCGAHPGEGYDGEETAQDLSGTVTLKEIASSKCADVSGGSLTNGTNVIQWTCSGHTNQQWALKSVGTNVFNLVNVNSGKCMDVSGARRRGRRSFSGRATAETTRSGWRPARAAAGFNSRPCTVGSVLTSPATVC